MTTRVLHGGSAALSESRPYLPLEPEWKGEKIQTHESNFSQTFDLRVMGQIGGV